MITKEQQEKFTPQEVLDYLKKEHAYFHKTLSEEQSKDIEAGKSGQFPVAAVLSCIDSRVPVEQVFDQSFGDLFVARVAGNIINADILGSLEYACAVAGSKVLVVLGHTACGAVASACKGVELGNITHLLSHVHPAIANIEKETSRDADDFVSKVEIENINQSLREIREQSPILADLESEGKLILAGAIYNIEDGSVKFL